LKYFIILFNYLKPRRVNMGKMNVLIIEDETKMARFIELELKYEDYDVKVSNDGREGLELFYKETFDIVLLDLMLPGLNGFEVCRRIRKVSDVPVIILSAKDEVMDKVAGLDIGANDYITKPFAIEELLARMRAVLRRRPLKGVSSTIVTFNDVEMDLESRVVKVGGAVVELTKKEFEVLLYLAQNKNNVISREQIFNKVWGQEVGETNLVDVYIRYLRTKIDERFSKRYIHTARGEGYFVKDE
jgi:two-component system response regulator ArlR